MVETEAEKSFSNCFVLQVDYESEEGEKSGDEDQEEVTEQPEEEVDSEQLSEERHDNSQPSSQQNVDGDTQESMRVNKVLQLSSSIEAYKYDQQKGLWCEVQSYSVPWILHCVSLLLNIIPPESLLYRSGRLLVGFRLFFQ